MRSPATPRAAPQAQRGPGAAQPTRLFSVDATRGWAVTILLIVIHPFPRDHQPLQLTHPEWHGVHFADLFFPLFLFAMGMAMTLSSRAADPRHMLRRVGLLVVLGVALSSLKHGRPTATGVLQHIALSYLLAWLVLRAPRRAQAGIAAGILGAVWIGFVLWAGPGQDPWAPVGTLSHAVDGWLFGGFRTEGLIPAVTSTVTVVGGALVGRRVKEHPDREALWKWLMGHALWLVAVALALNPVVPIVKRVWTPSFTLLTLGTSLAWLALFVWLVDVRGARRWVTPLRELGANPIAIYALDLVIVAAAAGLRSNMGHPALFGSLVAGSLLFSAGWWCAGWLFARALYRRRIFIRI